MPIPGEANQTVFRFIQVESNVHRASDINRKFVVQMASSAIFSTVVISVIVASTNGFRIENPQAARSVQFQRFPDSFVPSPAPTFGLGFRSTGPIENVNDGPIAGYPKVPPPNAHESGGHADDLLPPFESPQSGVFAPRGQSFRRSVENVRVDLKTGYPLQAEPEWKYAGGNEEILELPLEDSEKAAGQEQVAVDPKTGYPLVAQPSWIDAGGDGDILELPLKDSDEVQAVDPKTGYPLVAQPSWKHAGGNEESLEPPFEDSDDKSVGNKVEVDPKTGYPLVAQPSWRDAGGDEAILQLPFEDTVEKSVQQIREVDPKTGYPLLAESSWKHAGGDGEILEPPFEESNIRSDDAQEKVDPKTGYPLVAQPGWKHAGGDGEILEPPLDGSVEKSDNDQEKVDPKTGYPLEAQPSWKDAGGDGEILQPPLEESDTKSDESQGKVDPKTGYPLEAQPSWKNAGGDGEILQPPLEESDKKSDDGQGKVDPKTGYPLVAQPSWKDAGGNEDILKLPFTEAEERSVGEIEVRSGDVIDEEEYRLMELLPPPEVKNTEAIFRNSFATSSPILGRSYRFDSSSNLGSTQNIQKTNSFGRQQPFGFGGFQDRPVESSYSYTGPENVSVTVTRFLNVDQQNRRNNQGVKSFGQNSFSQSGFSQNGRPQDSQFSAATNPRTQIQSSSIQNQFQKAPIFQSNRQANGAARQVQFGQQRQQQTTIPQTTNVYRSNSNFKSTRSQ